MNIYQLIVHEIVKEINSKESQTFLSTKLLPIDEEATKIVNKLDEKYVKAGITYAVFSTDKNEYFPKNYKLMHDEDYTDIGFINFSQNSITILNEKLKKIPFAKGGYFLFADYGKNGERYFAIFLIRNTEGFLFKRDETNSSFYINPTEHIDLSKLAMACRINKLRYYHDDGKYLSFIKNNLPDISEYFINWIAAVEKENNSTYTDDLFKLTGLMPPPKDESNEPISIDLFRKKVHDYAKTSPENKINLPQLGLHFYKDEDIFIKVAEENKIIIDTEFKFDNRKGKKFVKIDVSADGVELRFTRDQYNSIVRFDEKNRNLVIIESESLANKLRNEIDSNEE